MPFLRHIALALAFVVAIFGSANQASALTETSIGPNLIVILTPKNPGPNQAVRALVRSYDMDTGGATFRWTLDGEAVLSGVEQDMFNFVTKGAGEQTALAINVTARDGTVAEKVITLNPASVSLIWEAESYTPTTYPGKALPSEGSRVFVVAMSNFVTADGTKIEDRNLSYEWVANFRPNRAASGVGKNVYVVDLPQGRAETDISVTVRENGGSLVASETLSIAPFAPRVLIYEEHPLLGTRYERALSDNYPLRSSEVTMRAEPYFLSGSISSFSYTWTLGGRFIPSFGRLGELLTLRLGDGSGTAPLSARATSASTQGGTNSKPLSIRFGSL